MAGFTVILDGQTLTNEPMGLQDAAISIQRNEDFPGLFTTMVSDLEFWGDGYDILYSFYSNNDLCVRIDCRIIEDCDNGLDFDGIIYLNDVEFNSYKCIATCSVEDNTAQGRILRLKDALVPINSVNQSTINGGSLANCTSHQFNTNGVYGNRFAFNVFDLLQYVLRYITDNDVTLVSDFLTSQNYRPQKLRVKCTFNTNGFPIQATWNDPYGNLIVRTLGGPALLSVVDDATYAQAVATMLNQQVFTDSGGNSYQDIVFPYAARTDFEIDPITGNVEHFVDIYFYHKTSISIICLGGPSTVTLVSSVDATYGAKNLYATNVSMIEPAVSMPSISLSNLFLGLHAFYNLSMSFFRVGGNLYLRVENQPYYFSNSESVSLSSVKDVMLKTENPLAFSSINYSNPTLSNTSVFYQDAGYVSNECSENEAGVSNYFLIPNDSYNGIVTNPKPAGGLSKGFVSTQENKWLLFEEDTDSLTTPKTILNMVQTGTISSIYQQNALITDPIAFTYAGSCIHPFIARNFLFRAPSGLRYAGYLLVNNLPIKIAKSLSFEYPLSRAEFNQVNSNPTKYIVVNGTRGWIMSVEHNLKTGMTTFELLTE